MRLARRILQRPFASLPLAMLLIGDVLTLPEETTVGGWKDDWVDQFTTGGARRSNEHPSMGIATATIDDSGVLRMWSMSWGRPWLSEEGRQPFVVINRPPPRYEGIWASTTGTFIYKPRISGDVEAFTDEQIARMVDRYADEIESRGYERFAGQAEGMRRGRPAETRVLWSGYARNALSALLALAFLYSLGWVPGGFREARGVYRLKRYRCPSCAYDIRRIRGDACPECGASIEAFVRGDA